MPRRSGAGEGDVGQRLVGVDRDRPLGPQLQLEPDVLAEPLALAVAVAAPPLDLVVGQVGDRQHRRLEQPAAYGDAGTAGGAGQRGGIEQVLRARARRRGRPRPAGARRSRRTSSRLCALAVLDAAGQVAVALDQHAELDQHGQRGRHRAAVGDRVEVDGQARRRRRRCAPGRRARRAAAARSSG